MRIQQNRDLHELYVKLAAAVDFASGMALVRQIEFALFHLLLHLGTLGDDPMMVIETARDEVAVIHPPAWHRFPHAFLHIFAMNYASGYYSYQWAEGLAVDGFAKFAEAFPGKMPSRRDSASVKCPGCAARHRKSRNVRLPRRFRSTHRQVPRPWPRKR